MHPGDVFGVLSALTEAVGAQHVARHAARVAAARSQSQLPD